MPSEFKAVSPREHIGLVTVDGKQVAFGLVEVGVGHYVPMSHTKLQQTIDHPTVPGLLGYPIGQVPVPELELMDQAIDAAYHAYLAS